MGRGTIMRIGTRILIVFILCLSIGEAFAVPKGNSNNAPPAVTPSVPPTNPGNDNDEDENATTGDSVPLFIPLVTTLTDDTGVPLSDGEYDIVVEIADVFGASLYTEMQAVSVSNGHAGILIGLGEPQGANFSTELFYVGTETSVEVLVAGQEIQQTIAVYGSQPYSFVAQLALNVAENSVGSAQILDGSITAADLSPDLIGEFLVNLQAGALELSTSTEDDPNGDKGPASHPNFVLKTEFEAFLVTNAGNLAALQMQIAGKVSKSGDTMLGELHMGNGAGITLDDGSTVDGRDLSVMGTTVDGLALSVAELALNKLDKAGGTVTGELTFADADVVMDGGDVHLGLEGRLSFNDDRDSFLVQSLAGEIDVATDGRHRFAFLNDDHTSLLTSGNIVARGVRRFSDSALKQNITSINVQDVMNAIRTDTLNGILYQCNADGSANLFQDINQPPGGGGGGITPVDFDVLCDDVTTFHYGVIAQVLSTAPNIDMPAAGNTDLVSTQILRTGDFETVDYDQITAMQIEAIQYIDQQVILNDPYVNEATDNMIGDLGMHNGANVNFYSDAGMTPTASIDGTTGAASFTGTVTLNNSLLHATTADNDVHIGQGEILITDADGSLSAKNGDILLSGQITAGGNVAGQTLSVSTDATVGGSMTVSGGLIINQGVISDGAIVSADIADNTVASADILDNTIASADILDNIITDNDIAPGAVGTSEIADGSIMSGDILDDTITSFDVAADTLTDNDLSAGSVGSLELADNGIVEADLQTVDAPSPGECLTFDAASGGFDWQSCGALTDIWVDEAGDAMFGDLAFYDDDPILNLSANETASISAMSGNAQFDGNMKIDGDATVGGDVVISKFRKFYLDIAGNTYISNVGPNTMQFRVGGFPAFDLASSLNATFYSHVLLPTSHGLHFDGGLYGTQIMSESPGTNLQFKIGGNKAFSLASSLNATFYSHVIMPAFHGFYLDGGNDTSIRQITDNVVRIETGSPNSFAQWNGVSGNLGQYGVANLNTNGDVQNWLANDAGSWSWRMRGSDSDRLHLISNFGSENSRAYFNTGGSLFLTDGNLSIASGNRFYLDGGSDTYINQPTTNIINFAAGGDTDVMQIKSTGVTITTGNNLTMTSGNITMASGKTVDGVDVSNLRDRVGDVEQNVAFAYGTMKTAGGLSCTNRQNISSGCNFITSPGSNYVVTFSVVGTGGGCGAYAPFCYVQSKSSTTFRLKCACPSGGIYNATFDFVVYAP